MRRCCRKKMLAAVAGGCAITLPAMAGPGGAPVNDACANAINVNAGAIAYNTSQATTDGPDIPAACDEGFGTAFVKDIWYRFTPAGTGTLTVSTCAGANYDTRLAAYTGECGKLTLVACNDDSPVCTGDRSFMQVPVNANQAVLIRVGGFDSGGTGVLTLTSDIPPANDDCASALEIGSGAHAVTTINATTDGPPLPPTCNQGTGLNFVNDVWFTHTPQCTGTLTVSTCNGANFDTRLAAYSGACGSLSLLACNDDAPGCLANTSSMDVPVVCGEPVLLRVGAFNGSGNMLLTLSCAGKPCPKPCPADINHSGAVDVADLLAVITTWGVCPTPPDPCPTDIAPLGSPPGDGVVNVADLLMVITSWGACP